MNKKDIPQDPSALLPVTKELSYAVDDSGQYTTGLSTGWAVKAEALDLAWQDIEKRVADAMTKVKNGEASPVLLYMEKKLMDLAIVASYTGFWKWQVKRHLKPSVFKSLSDKKLQRYADVFEITLQELKSAGQ